MKHLLKISLFLAFVFAIFYSNLRSQTFFNSSNSNAGNTVESGAPVTWELTTNKISDCEFELVFKGEIKEHWHIYSLSLPSDDGPLPSAITFTKNENFELVGKPTEGTPISAYDSIFEMNVTYFENTVTFKQKIKLKNNRETIISGSYEYQACIEEKCIFPPATPFEFKLTGTSKCINAGVKLNPHIEKPEKTAIINTTSVEEDTAVDNQVKSTTTTTDNKNILKEYDENDETTIKGKPWWIILLTGFIWGFAALFTPCVFPLIPMNVSFFLKTSKTKAEGKINALIYVISIIVIFVSLGLGITTIFGGGALNSLATSAWFNGFIFILLVIFAASFLGAFEITLPSSFVNKIDKQSDRGGLTGIFFMALTLVVVSFSCTGPMVGNALFAAANSGNTSGAFWAMLGFSSGLALPFGFFAFFPSLLNSVPKSGGWLNTVKVVLGFLELALALKFASNVDLVYQMGILTREVFITIWIAIFGLITIYLIGGFKTAHDSETNHLSVTRLFFIMISFSMTIYILPGLWGAPLNLLSGVLPPLEYSESPHGFGASTDKTSSLLDAVDPEFRKHIEINKNGILHFKNDYEHALAYSKKIGKPLLIDFTGRACANCRKTEDYIWPDHEVTKRLNNDVVLVSLYVDEKSALDPSEVQTVFWYGKEREITTIGDKYKYMEETKYKQLSQPLYVLVDNNEELLSAPRGYESGIQEYISWLDGGVATYNKRKESQK